jgi:hypothetical protein
LKGDRVEDNRERIVRMEERKKGRMEEWRNL